MDLGKATLLHKAVLALLVILLPISFSFVSSYIETSEHMKAHTLDDLTVVAEAYEGQVYQYLEMATRRAEDFSSDGLVVALLAKALKGDRAATEALSRYIAEHKMTLDRAIVRVYVVSMAGMVVATTDRAMLGRDISGEEIFRRGAGGDPVVAEVARVEAPEIVASAPVIDGGRRIGVMFVSQGLSELSRVLAGEFSRDLGALTWSKGKRKTMEAYIVNRDSLLITESRFIKGAMLNLRVDNEAVRACLASKGEMSGFYADYRGVEVAGASMCLPHMGWTLLVEVDSSEILAPLKSIKRNAIAAAFVTVGLILLVFYLSYRSIILRLAALSSASSRMAYGLYDTRVAASSGDEIGRLSESFNRMSAEINSRTALLEESEAKYRSLVANIPDVTWTAARDTEVVYASANVMDILGYSSDEVCREAGFWRRVMHDEDRERILAAFEALFSTGRRFDEQYRMMRKDGSFAWVYDRAVATYERDGRRLADGVFTDITERKMADLLQSLSLHIKEAESFDSAIRVVIDKVCEFTGWSYGEVWMPRADGAAIEHGRVWVSRAPAHDGFASYSTTVVMAPGEGVPGMAWQEKKTVWMADLSMDGDGCKRKAAALDAGLNSAIGVPVMENERVLAVLVFLMSRPLARDRRVISFVTAVTAQLGSNLQRKLDVEERMEIQKRYEDLLDSITVGVYRDSLTGEGGLVEVNRAVVTMLEGSSREEVLARGFKDFCVDHYRCREVRQRLLKNGHIRGEEIELATLRGKRIWVSVTAVRKSCADGCDCVDGIIEDISEKKRLEEQLRHSQKLEAVGQLAGGVAHDFNNILTAIIGYGNLLIIKKGSDEHVRGYASQMITLSEKAAQLTQSLLVFSRKQVMNPQPVDINSLIKRVEKILARIIGEEIDLRTSFSELEAVVKVDPTQMEQVFMNLATNARDAMGPGGGTLSISTRVVEIDDGFISAHGYGVSGEYVLITVADTGSGMDEETRKRIFEPFFTTKEVGRGTGLGLAVVYGIIKQHGGYINVASRPGMGSTFSIYLPIIGESVETVPEGQPEEIIGGSETILLAEDEAAVREVNKSMLEEFGYKVIEAVDGVDAVEKFRAVGAEVSLLLLDLMMPRKSGREAFEEISRLSPGVKAIFMSGYAVDIMRERGALGAGIELVQKPASPGELLRKVRETLDR